MKNTEIRLENRELLVKFLEDEELSIEERDAWKQIYDIHARLEASASHELDELQSTEEK